MSCFVACAWCNYEGIIDVLFDPEQDDSGQWECPQEHWNELPADHYLPVRRPMSTVEQLAQILGAPKGWPYNITSPAEESSEETL